MISTLPKPGDLVKFRPFVREPHEYGLVQRIQEPDKDYFTAPSDLEVVVVRDNGKLFAVPFLLVDEIVQEHESQ